MAEFIVLVLALIVLSLMGHLCWLGLRALFKLFVPSSKCPTCGRPLDGNNRCPSCTPAHSPRPASAAPSPQEDLIAAGRLLQYARFAQLLPEEQIESIESCLVRLNHQLSGLPLSAEVLTSTPSTQAAWAPVDHLRVHPPAAQPQNDHATGVSALDIRPVDVPPRDVPPRDVHPRDVPPLDVHPLDEAEPSQSSAAGRAASAPAQLSADILRSFMERSNIRWIELVSATLVVVCSVGLVISLWSTLSRTSRFFPSLVFMLATLAVHGAGQYTLRRWKLRTTSRGILHIGLMLIPLSVLVGILLSRRGELPEVSWGSALAVAVGTVVYTGLAFTASRSLFSRLYAPIALLTVVSSLTLLPIALFSARGGAPLWAVGPLLPLATTSALVALWLSRLACMRSRWTSPFARRHMGMAVQALFATVAACVFSLTQLQSAGARLQSAGAMSPWWWSLVGFLAVGWSGWAWAVSASPLGQPRQRDRDVSWAIVTGGVIGLIGTVFLVASLWQTSFTRGSLIALLTAAAVGWLLHGSVCRLRPSLLAGALSTIVAVALGGESLQIALAGPEFAPLSAVDWISFQRTTWLTATGGVMALVAYALLSRLRWPVPPLATTPYDWAIAVLLPRERPGAWSPLSGRLVIEQMLLAGCVGVLAGAALTILASFVPAGRTPYGGNWAPISLAIYGIAITAAGIMSETKRHQRWILPVGQALTILAVVRLCQTSSLMPAWLIDLRPGRSWAVGLSVLAAAWSGLALVLSQTGKRSRVAAGEAEQGWLAVDWLCAAAALLASISALALWRLSDRLLLAAEVGWMLPLVAVFIWWAWRSAIAREIALISLCLWLTACLFTTGDARNWWGETGLAGSVAAHTLVCITTCALFVGLWRRLQPPRAPAWTFSGTAWATAALLIVCIVTILISVAPPALEGLGASLGTRLENSQLHRASTFVLQRPDAAAFAALAAAVALAVPVTVYASRLSNLLWLRSLVALAPLSLALAAAAWTSPPWSLVAAAWILAASLLASEGLAYGSRLWQEQSKLAWERQVSSEATCLSEFHWLALGRAITLAALLVLSAMAVVQGWRGQLPSELLPDSLEVASSQTLSQTSSQAALQVASQAWRLSRLAALLAWLGAPLCVVAVRWCLSVVGDARPRLTNLSGALTAVIIACLCSLAVTAVANRWVVVGITFLQAAAASIAILAGATAGYALTRNYMALHALSRGQARASELFAKSRKGGRWKRAETSAWSLVDQGLMLLCALCVIAATTIVWMPVETLPTLSPIARWPSLAAYAAVLLVFIALGRMSAISRFALLAVALGLLAPLVSSFYAQWLESAPGRYSAAAKGFEPYRAQLVLWMIALGVGWLVRVANHRRETSAVGEALWIAMASIVGALSLIASSMDPGKVWPAGLLSALALVTVLSGLASRQAWRGHLAAVTAAIGILTYNYATWRRGPLEPIWLMLWGPVWIALCAVAWTIAEQWTKRSRGLEPIEGGAARGWRLSVDQTVSVHVPITICLLSGLWIALAGPQRHLNGLPWIVGLAGAAWALAISRLWDWRTGSRGLAVYLATLSASLTTAAAIVDVFDVPKNESALLWMAAGLAALAIMAGCLREWMRERARLLPALRLGALKAHGSQFDKARQWMVPLHSAIGLVLLLPCLLLVLDFDQPPLRLATAALPFISAISILPIAIDRHRPLPRVVGLILISFAAIFFSWSDLQPAGTQIGASLDWYYFQRSFVPLVILGWGYAWLSEPLKSKVDWQRLLHHAGWICLALGALLGAVMLGGAAAGFWGNAWRTASLATKLATLPAWCGVVGRCLMLALAPRGLDATVSLVMRQAAVYAAELGLGLLTAATYACFPDLFGGIFARWWPLVVFAIAMLSGAIGHWSARAGHVVLSDPVRRSSLLLTLIPLVAVWWPNISSAGIDWSDSQRFSLLLLIAASLYGLHGWLRPSVGLSVLAAGLTLLSYWSLLHSQPNLRFFEHPQFWLLPPALATLIFVESNRRRLHASVVIASRYSAVLLAYLSSTAELLLKAFEGQMWQPLVLLVLALAGVLCGVALRVRAFLYCGSAFVLVALLGMVWHAQQAIDQVWPWWAFGILSGITLIALLGYFEKNRPQVLAYLEHLKSWEQ